MPCARVCADLSASLCHPPWLTSLRPLAHPSPSSFYGRVPASPADLQDQSCLMAWKPKLYGEFSSSSYSQSCLLLCCVFFFSENFSFISLFSGPKNVHLVSSLGVVIITIIAVILGFFHSSVPEVVVCVRIRPGNTLLSCISRATRGLGGLLLIVPH